VSTMNFVVLAAFATCVSGYEQAPLTRNTAQQHVLSFLHGARNTKHHSLEVNASASIGQVHQEVSKQRYSISAAIEHWSNEIMGLMMILCLGAAGACWYLLQSWVADEHADRDIRISSNFLGGGDSCKDRDGYVFRYHRIPWEQYVALAFWYCLLLTNACLTRLVCHAGIPHDCHGHLDALRGLHTFDRLMKDGFIIAVLTGVAQRDRFAYLFDLSSEGWFRGLLFLLVFLGTSPVFGSLDLIPSLSAFSLTTGCPRISLQCDHWCPCLWRYFPRYLSSCLGLLAQPACGMLYLHRIAGCHLGSVLYVFSPSRKSVICRFPPSPLHGWLSHCNPCRVQSSCFPPPTRNWDRHLRSGVSGL